MGKDEEICHKYFTIVQVGSLGILAHLAFTERNVLLKLKKKSKLKPSMHVLKVLSSLSLDTFNKTLIYSNQSSYLNVTDNV